MHRDHAVESIVPRRYFVLVFHMPLIVPSIFLCLFVELEILFSNGVEVVELGVNCFCSNLLIKEGGHVLFEFSSFINQVKGLDFLP